MPTLSSTIRIIRLKDLKAILRLFSRNERRDFKTVRKGSPPGPFDLDNRPINDQPPAGPDSYPVAARLAEKRHGNVLLSRKRAQWIDVGRLRGNDYSRRRFSKEQRRIRELSDEIHIKADRPFAIG